MRKVCSDGCPFVCQLKDAFVDGETLHIVLEFCEGGDLHTLLKARGKALFDEETVLGFAIQLLLGLKHCHDRRVLHRDLKLQNIILKDGTK